ncbi:MAG: monovalent cation/H+ antiporter subunit D family protein [Thermoleophilia bacterium]
MGLSLAFAIAGLIRVLDEGPQSYYLGGWPPPFGIEYVLDHLSGFMAVVVAGIAFLALAYSRRSIIFEAPGKFSAFYGVAMLLVSGLLGIVLTGDLFNLYVFLEISSLSAYALLSVGNRQAPFAAFRYIIMGTIGGTFYLLGVGYLYFHTGTLNMVDMAARLSELGTDSRAVVAAAGFITIGLGLKMALFPLHMWLPDAYTSGSSASVGLIAPIMTKVAAYSLIRVLFGVFGADYVAGQIPLTTLIGWLAAVGIIWGSVMAIAQKDFRRMLAYSSVSQVAYIGLGIGLGNPLALIGALLQVLSHAATKACLFLVAGGIRHRTGTDRIPNFVGLGRIMPWTMMATAVAALSMIGLPPTSGFFVKWYLVLGSIEAENWPFVAVVILSGLLNAVYFFRVLEKAYLEVPEFEIERSRPELPRSMLWPILALAAIILVAGVANFILVDRILEAAVPAGL